MVGDTIREARIKKGLTQAKLARLAGVSRRHLAALEKGANVSILVLNKVATVLELHEIQVGNVSLKSGEADRGGVNVPLLTDTIREARVEAERAQAILARAEGLLGGNGDTDDPIAVSVGFPSFPIRRLEVVPASEAGVREKPDMLAVEISGEIRQGQPVDDGKREMVLVPSALIEKGEVVFRARGEGFGEQAIHDGDLLIVQLRQRGKANTGELVITKLNDNVFIGRWWQKHGLKALMSDGFAEVTTGRVKRGLKVVGVINQIIRPIDEE